MKHQDIAKSSVLLMFVIAASADFVEDTCKQGGEKKTAKVAVTGERWSTIPVSFECTSYVGSMFKDVFHHITKCYTDDTNYIKPWYSGKITITSKVFSDKTYCMTCDDDNAPKVVRLKKSSDTC